MQRTRLHHRHHHHHPLHGGSRRRTPRERVDRSTLSPSPTPTPRGRRRAFRDAVAPGASVRPTIRSDNDVPTIWFVHTPGPRPAQGPHGASGADAPRRRRHPNSPRRPRLSARRLPAGHRSQDPQATEHRGDARPRQPGPGLRRRGLGGGARGGRGRATRHRPRPGASGCGGAQAAARGGTPARASPGGSFGIRAAGEALVGAARTARRGRTLVRRDRGVPAGGRRRHRRQYRHRRDARGERPRGCGRADALLHAPVCEPRGARGRCAQAPRRRSRDAARLGARGPAPRDARGQRLGGVPRGRGRRAAVDAASHRGAAVRQRWLRREGRGAARGAARGDSCGEGGRRHGPRRVHLLADRPMTATTTTLNGPVSRIDPATAYRRPESVPGLLRLDSNEGVLPSPALLGDLANADPELLRRYPDVSALEAALAARVGVAPERVVGTAGGDEGIARACRAFLEPGRTILHPDPSFDMFDCSATLAGGELVRIPWRDEAFPIEAFISRLDALPAVVAVVSPNNPTGSVATLADVRRLAAAAPNALLILDHVYVEYADHDLTPAVLDLPNVLVLRTLSKAWGLAGCRVGYAVGSPYVVAVLRAAGGPYTVAAPSVALALSQLERGVERSEEHTSELQSQRRLLSARLAAAGLAPRRSQANFVLVECGPRAGSICAGLATHGVVVRDFPGRRGLETALRITLPGSAPDFERLSDALERTLQAEGLEP